jgi:hypothetical protein
MKGFILGFQRRVWWPKWIPASSRLRIETDGMNWPPAVTSSAALLPGTGSPRAYGTAPDTANCV